MKTLVIHPQDASTQFLSAVYAGKGYDVLAGSEHGVNELLSDYDRVIAMGHGIPSGLLSTGKFPGAFALDVESVPGLRGKDNVYIWCWADKFMNEHALRGFSTGMFISEVGEAAANGIEATQEMVNHSNALFASVMRKLIDGPDLLRVREMYDGELPHHPV